MRDRVIFNSPSHLGGGKSIKMVEMMNRLDEIGASVYYISPEPPENHSIEHVPEKKGDIGYGIGFIIHLLVVFVTLLRVRPDSYVPFDVYGGLVGVIAKPMCGCDVSLFLRGDTFEAQKRSDATVDTVFMCVTLVTEKMSIAYADRVVFISESLREKLLERTGIGVDSIDSTILQNNVYTPRIKAQLDMDTQSFDGWPRIGYLGRFPANGEKGVRDLITVTSTLLERYPEMTLVLIGDGANRDGLEQQVRRADLEDVVQFIGWVDEPIPYLRGLDLLVLPSRQEGLGNVLLEALAAEIPICGSDVGGIPEIVPSDDLLFEPGNPDDIAATIGSIFKDEETYEELSQLCDQRRGELDFDWAEWAIAASGIK